MKASPEELKREVEAIREGMTPVLDELDHRRHEMMDWRLQLQKHRPAILKGLAAAVAMFTVVTLARSAQRARALRKRRRSPRPI